MGNYVFGGGSIIVVSWLSRTQHCVMVAYTEAEYIAMDNAMKEILFLPREFAFFRPESIEKNITVFEDNEGVI